jgi:tetratricopeptide (TPR) repeat protein
MTSQNVADCVAAQGDAYAGYGPAFVAQKIDGKFLMSVENDDIEPTLTKVGVTNPHHVAALRTLLLSVRSVALIEATLPPTAEGEEGIEQLEVLMRTANTLFQQEKLEDARALYEKALEGFERLVGPEHPSTVSVVNNLGTLLYTQQKLGDAQQMYERALVGRDRVLGPQVCACGGLGVFFFGPVLTCLAISVGLYSMCGRSTRASTSGHSPSSRYCKTPVAALSLIPTGLMPRLFLRTRRFPR